MWTTVVVKEHHNRLKRRILFSNELRARCFGNLLRQKLCDTDFEVIMTARAAIDRCNE